MKCPECGIENPDSAEFCKECGKKLNNQKNILKEPVSLNSIKLNDSTETKKIGWWKRQTTTGKILSIFFSICIIGIILIVAVGFTLLDATKLEISNPSNDINNNLSAFDKFTLFGVTDPNAIVTVYVNGSQVNSGNITADQNGNFNYTVTKLPFGKTLITIVAKAPNKSPSQTAILYYNRTESKNGEQAAMNLTYNNTFNFTK